MPSSSAWTVGGVVDVRARCRIADRNCLCRGVSTRPRTEGRRSNLDGVLRRSHRTVRIAAVCADSLQCLRLRHSDRTGINR